MRKKYEKMKYWWNDEKYLVFYLIYIIDHCHFLFDLIYFVRLGESCSTICGTPEYMVKERNEKNMMRWDNYEIKLYIYKCHNLS